ncbi:MAG: hypothetical protein ACLQU3_07885 [Limisphaerales bacterium]
MCATGFLIGWLWPHPYSYATQENERAAYSAAGILTVSNLASVTRGQAWNYSFKIATSNGLWSIESEDDRTKLADGSPISRMITAGTDGIDIYILTRIMPAVAPRQDAFTPVMPEGLPASAVMKPIEQASLPLLQAFVTAGTRPTFDENLQLLWFALLSGPYLDTYGTTGLQPLSRVEPEARSDEYRTELTRYGAAPGLPLSASFMSPGYYHGPHGALKSFGKAYSQGFLSGAYHANQWTNLEGFNIPIDFEYQEFGPVFRPSTNTDQRPLRSCHGKVLSISQFPGGRFLPLAPPKVDVIDYRFQGKDPNIGFLRYNLPQAGWQSASSEMLGKLFEARIAGVRNRPQAAPTARAVTLGVMFLITVLPIAWFFYIWFNKQKHMNNENE